MSGKPQPNSPSPNSPEDSPKDSSKGSSDSTSRQALPFEPTKSRKQAEKTPAKASVKPPAKAAAPRSSAVKASPKTSPQTRRPDDRSTLEETAIPEEVSRRMIRRMAILCGVPSALGMSTFVVSYLLRVNDVFQVPTYAVLLVSLGWFGLGVVGLSYGLLSASWDEEVSGSWAGWTEFTTNLGRMTQAWRSSKTKS